MNELSPRQSEVLALVAAGLTSREIGCRLGVKVKAIESHRRCICEKLGAINSCHAVKIAMAAGLVEEVTNA